ncbi:type VI secretion system baseplate subunit TssG [Pseudoalteromonas sp. A3]|uniref:type VI secretion system baseplate subunit TssG n=1 Tax=Pseudoalteromonas sp. A3 TaxID=142792 RepID=UPI00221F6BA7|nr:type VI secretion system baseplate subunit TssG [Pseudoalteromonas sp. A3]MCW1720146.1 type VI secretion system baseplate subunit TssG [Pseudoalteromonas sp. A3]
MIENLISQTSQVDFYKAVFIIESQLKKNGLEYRHVGYDSSPKLELIKFTATQKLGFPGNAISKIENIGYEDNLAKVNIEVSFMGLTGCAGALPQFYSELVLQRLRFKDTTMRDFYDMFNHRLVSLYYRAWKKYKPSLNHINNNKSKDPYTKILGLLSGGYRESQLHFSGMYSRKVRNASDLQSILTYYLGCDVKIQQMIGQWKTLKIQEQTSLPSRLEFEGRHARLGVDTVLGKQVWDISSLVEVHIFTENVDKARALLPNGTLFILAKNITKDYLGRAVQFRLEVKSNFHKLKAIQLGVNDYQLGNSSFLVSNKDPSTFSPTQLSFKG